MMNMFDIWMLRALFAIFVQPEEEEEEEDMGFDLFD